MWFLSNLDLLGKIPEGRYSDVALVGARAELNHNAVGKAVDVRHALDLYVTLGNIILVNTDSVYLESSRPVRVPKVLQRNG